MVSETLFLPFIAFDAVVRETPASRRDFCKRGCGLPARGKHRRSAAWHPSRPVSELGRLVRTRPLSKAYPARLRVQPVVIKEAALPSNPSELSLAPTRLRVPPSP